MIPRCEDSAREDRVGVGGSAFKKRRKAAGLKTGHSIGEEGWMARRNDGAQRVLGPYKEKARSYAENAEERRER